jgi:transcriptional regulator with XRE-family HTH domain
MVTFGERLRELRKNKGLTQTELGDQIGYKRRMVQFLESNDREPNLSTIIKLCELFDCSADYLLGRVDDPQGEKEALYDIIKKELDQVIAEDNIDSEAFAKHKMYELFMKVISAEIEKK